MEKFRQGSEDVSTTSQSAGGLGATMGDASRRTRAQAAMEAQRAEADSAAAEAAAARVRDMEDAGRGSVGTDAPAAHEPFFTKDDMRRHLQTYMSRVGLLSDEAVEKFMSVSPESYLAGANPLQRPLHVGDGEVQSGPYDPFPSRMAALALDA